MLHHYGPPVPPVLPLLAPDNVSPPPPSEGRTSPLFYRPIVPTRASGSQRTHDYGQSMVVANRRVRRGVREEKAQRTALRKRMQLPRLRGSGRNGGGGPAISGRQGAKALPLTRVAAFNAHATAPLRRSEAPRLRARTKELVSSYNPYLGASSTVSSYQAFLTKVGVGGGKGKGRGFF